MLNPNATEGRFLSTCSHLTAGMTGLLYAWMISNSHYVTTGVQFVSPLAIILIVHILWIYARRALMPGFAAVAIRRTLVTSMGGAVLIFLASVYAPTSVQASTPAMQAASSIIPLLFCIAILAVVGGIGAFMIFAIAHGIAWTYRAIKERYKAPEDSNDTRFFDFASVATVLCTIGIASLEGVTWAYSFSSHGQSTAVQVVSSPPSHVWKFVAQATSPAFPLPAVLKVFPQPVAVTVDEGASLGARRIVRISGREGEGNLMLKVIKRTRQEVVFQAVSDTSPIASWIKHKSLTYRVTSHHNGSKLAVTLDYERRLAPAWFFNPAMKLSAYFAMDVLARDTKIRAEQS